MQSMTAIASLRRPKVKTFALATLALLSVASGVAGATIEKANNTTILSGTGSWVGGVVPTSGDTAEFDSVLTGTSTAANVGLGISVNGLLVTNTGASFSITANGTHTLTLGTGGIDMSSASNGTNDFTIASLVVLNAAQTFNVAASRTLTISGKINNSGDNLTTTGAGTIDLSGVISGSGSFLQTTDGSTVTLSAANSYTGDTTVRAGTLQVAGAAASGANGVLGNSTDAVVLGDSGTISTDDIALLMSSTTTGKSVGRDIDVNNYGNSTTIGGLNTSGTNTFSGTIALSEDVILTAASGGTINFTGNITGSANITKTGAGTIALKGTNDANMGSVTISAGTLNISGGSAIGDNSAVTISSGANLGVVGSETVGSISGAGNVTFSNAQILTVGGNNQSTTVSGVIQGGNANSGLTKTGTGTLTLNGVNTYIGTTAVNAGTVLIDLSTNPTGVLAATSKLNLGGGTLNVQGQASGTSTQTIGVMTLAANTSSSLVVNGAASTSTTLTLSNTWTRNAGSTLNIDLSAANSYLTSSPTVTNGTINAAVTVTDATGTGFGTVTSGNIVRLIPTTILPGTATTAATNYYLDATGTTTLSGTEAINSLTINATSAGTIDLKNGTLTVASGGVLDTDGSNYTITNGTLGANNKEVIIHQMGTGTLTINATLSGGTGSLTKDGAGSLVLTHNNTFTGATVVSAGTLQLGDGTTNGAVGGVIVNNASTIFDNGSAQTYAGVISGSGAVSKTGAGNLTLTGSSIFTGTTTVSQGTLTLAAASSPALSGTSAIIVNTGGTLAFGANNQLSSTMPITLAGGTLLVNGASQGAVGVAGVGVLTLSANSTIDLGSSNGVIAFANSSSATWSPGGVLTIQNWAGNLTGGGNDEVSFGADDTGLSASQLAQVEFVNPTNMNAGIYNSVMLSDGELVPAVPEPSTYAAGAALAALVLLREYRRRQTAQSLS